MKNNKNMCSIFHAKFKNLIKVIPNPRKAQLMDYILLGWQTSTYTLKNSDKKWFMKPHDEIAMETGISPSTIRDYLKQLEDEGFIERRQARYNRKSNSGEYYVTMGGYINITEKFLHLLKAGDSSTKNPSKTQSSTTNTTIPTPPQKEQNKANSSNFNKNQLIDPLKTSESYIRDLRTSFNNNIKFKKLIDSVDKFTLEKLIRQYEAIHQFVNTEVKEEIPDEIKKLLLGTFFNLTFENKKLFSVPEQVAAEYLFSLINTAFCLPKVHDFKHRNDILSKIVRQNNWKTPKGFYKHFYLGQEFKDQHELQEQRWKKQKAQEINPGYFIEEQKDERLIQLEEQMLEKNILIDKLKHQLYEQSSNEGMRHIQEQISRLKTDLESLWHQQGLIEEEQYKTTRLCA